VRSRWLERLRGGLDLELGLVHRDGGRLRELEALASEQAEGKHAAVLADDLDLALLDMHALERHLEARAQHDRAEVRGLYAEALVLTRVDLGEHAARLERQGLSARVPAHARLRTQADPRVAERELRAGLRVHAALGGQRRAFALAYASELDRSRQHARGVLLCAGRGPCGRACRYGGRRARCGQRLGRLARTQREEQGSTGREGSHAPSQLQRPSRRLAP
jgi:hypothetical protein